MRRVLPALAAMLLCVAAGKPWSWSVPSAMVPPDVPVGNPMSAAKVELGRRLFYDADLSANGTMACAACHEQKHAFADGNRTRPGVHGDAGRRNVPGLANVAWFPRLTYADPGVTSLEAQVLIPLVGERPVEMGMKGMEAELAQRLGADPCYRKMFRRAFPERAGAIDTNIISAALASFQRTFVSFASPYDRYKTGESFALSPLAAKGATVFEESGCASCHSGPLLSDMSYHRVASEQGDDLGLAETTGRSQDAGLFRTPSLRNVGVTGPWWHDGSAPTLAAAIERHPTAPPAADVPALVSFLDDLTDRQFISDNGLTSPTSVCGRRL